MTTGSALLMLVGLTLFARVSDAAPPPLPEPNFELRDVSPVNAVLRLGDGSLVVGGDFDSVYDPTVQIDIGRPNLARYGPTGELDLDWNPAPDGPVHALATDASGDVYVAGDFGQIGGVARRGLAKVAGNGTGMIRAWEAPELSPCNFGTCVHALATDGGALYVLGDFSGVGAEFRPGLARLLASGALDVGWAPSIGGRSLALANGHAYLGGAGVMRVSTSGDGSADPAWGVAASGGTNGFPTVEALAFGPDGFLYVGGDFDAIGGQARASLARLSTGGSGIVDASWNPTTGGSYRRVEAIAPALGPFVFVAGYFDAAGGLARRAIAKLGTSGAGAADPAWSAQLTSSRQTYVAALAPYPDGTVAIGGVFSRAGGELTLGSARLAADGSLARAHFAQTDPHVRQIAAAPDGTVYVAGDFARAGTLARDGLLRLGPDGRLDSSWDPRPEGAVEALATDVAGRVYVGGRFTRIAGLARPNLVRFDGTDTPDSWAPAPDGPVSTLHAEPTGTIFVAGEFASIAGGPRMRLARVTTGATATLVPGWTGDLAQCPSPFIRSIAVGTTAVFVAGDMTCYFGNGAAAYEGVVKLSLADGSPDLAWNPLPTFAEANRVAVDGDAVYVTGRFDMIGGQSHRGLARIAATTGAVDPTWRPFAGTVRFGDAIVLDPTGVAFVAHSRTGLPEPDSIARITLADAAIDPSYDPGFMRFFLLPGQPIALSGDRLFVGGDFLSVSGEPRRGLAALPTVTDPIFASGFE